MYRALITIGLVISLGQGALASPHYRFWRGWKLNALTFEGFQKQLNDTFIPATVEVGTGRGLISYLPLLTQRPEMRPGALEDILPDEIALVIYSSEEEYKKLRETPEGKAYGDLHWTVFDKEKGSKSAVAENYQGSLEPNHSYDVLQSQADWQKGHVVFEITRVKSQPTPYIDRLKSQAAKRGLLSYLVLHGEQYFIEYQLWKNKRSQQLWAGEITKEKAPYLESIPKFSGEARKSSAYNSKIQFGEAINTQFPSQKKVTANPYEYAEQYTQAFAEETSDMEPYGVEDCVETDTNPSHPKIECAGKRTILVFGGHDVTVDFSCQFDFKKMPTGKYLVSEECDR